MAFESDPRKINEAINNVGVLIQCLKTKDYLVSVEFTEEEKAVCNEDVDLKAIADKAK